MKCGVVFQPDTHRTEYEHHLCSLFQRIIHFNFKPILSIMGYDQVVYTPDMQHPKFLLVRRIVQGTLIFFVFTFTAVLF